MLRGAKEGLGWGMGGDGVANYSRGEKILDEILDEKILDEKILDGGWVERE